jgi:glycosyltransferase involved in cell wall biosynthesis
MLASLEYQLAGLPVVSTASKGGRDTYYHLESCLIVEANPKAVKAGVLEMANRNLDPQLIRQQTIRQLEGDRRQYVDQLTAYVQKDSGIGLNPDSLYVRLFSDPRANFIPLPPSTEHL